ncbi:dienelactone hydrolase family protein [Chromobacterium aquaticum]|uniref:Dienelactone hydrolase family protein n=1 Tax=Chromobacterium aquaticum TaxID=467180 RepID=A0ABV8ZRX1_9NEIS|nr:dienelactone hydrolase family protein [Chromobacterium aquaticum]MCD5363777.1 dienelactone hydrolase family protein [Chromobacterium aquaticum]
MTSNRPIDASRRDFLNSAVGVGFALAVQPIAASAIITDGAGLSAGAVEIPTGPAIMPGYAAKPAAASGPLPVVLVVQEIFGVHEHIRDLCRRLAKAGYLAVAPELYFRQGDPSKVASISELVSGLVSKVPDSQVLADLDATLAWAGGNGGDAKRAAITGFCWGGRQVWLYAAHNPRIKAGVAWYGRLQGEPSANTPRQPLDIVAQLHAPVLGLYGGLDKGIPLESVDKMKAALRVAGKPSEIVVYPEADHGFNADYRPSYNAAAANDGWQRMLQWFKQHGA